MAANLLPNVFKYLKNTHRIVSAKDNKELNYRLSAYIDKEYDICQQIIEITFEEFANTMANGKELLFSFGNVGIDVKSVQFYCTIHNKFKKFYGKRKKSK